MLQRLFGYKITREKAIFIQSIAICHGKLDDNKTELEFLLKSYDMRLKLYGNSEHQEVLSTLNHLCRCYKNNGDVAKAMLFKEKSDEMKAKLASK